MRHPFPASCRAFTSWSPTPPALRVTPANGGRLVRLAPARKPGFSLLELILVLVVLGITSAVAASRLSALRQSEGVGQAAHALADQLGRGRLLAATHGDLARLRLDLDAQTTWMQVRSAAGFSDPTDGEPADFALRQGNELQTLTFTGADAKEKKTGLVDILFYPDNRCDPSGKVTFAKGSSSMDVVFPPTGAPARVEATP